MLVNANLLGLTFRGRWVGDPEQAAASNFLMELELLCGNQTLRKIAKILLSVSSLRIYPKKLLVDLCE